MAEVTMPRLSDTMSEGTVGRWLKKPGDTVEVGDIIAEIETDKATMELESFEKGTLQEIVVPEGQTVPIGQTIAIIGDGSAAPASNGAPTSPQGNEAPAQREAAGDAAPPTGATQVESEEGGDIARERTETQSRADISQGAGDQGGSQQAAGGTSSADLGTAGTAQGYNEPATDRPHPPGERLTPTDGQARDNGHGERVMASPVARRLAEEYGIDLRQIKGTGPGGRIIKENVEEFRAQHGSAPAQQAPAPQAPAPEQARAPQPAPQEQQAPAPQPQQPAPAPSGEVQPLSRMRKAIARAMTTAKPGTPHIYVTVEIDMAATMQLRKQINDSGAAPTKISVNDFVVKAAALALRKFPSVNASYTDNNGQPGVIQHPNINVSVAVALDDGLTAPVVRDTDKKSLGTISSEIRDMAGRAREGKIKQNELEAATFQVTNLGMFDVVEFDSIITSPQAASLAVGAVREVPVVRDGQIVVGEIMSVTLSADHRIVDGAVAAQYLQELKRLLQAPMGILV
jgi:pyruvate dehydrogenase E2 component (dihydrolipoamide acetyltransferase)